MTKWILDIETDSLLDTATVVWMICAKQLGVENYVTFSEHHEGALPLSAFNEWADQQDKFIMHNGMRFDAPAIKKLMGYQIPKDKIIDTLIMSRCNKWLRFPNGGRPQHSMKVWGEKLGEAKGDFKAFDAYTPEMHEYCIQDLVVNERIYQEVVSEARDIMNKKPQYKDALRLEHDSAWYTHMQTENGWQFDFDKCEQLIVEIGADMQTIEEAIEPHLEDITRVIDDEDKTPQYKKDGTYTAVSARMIGEYLGEVVSPEDALKAVPPMKPGETFRRTKVIPAGMGQQDSVKDYMEKLGVVWTQWNWKKVDNQFIKTGPKLNDDDLLRCDHPHTKMVSEYYTMRSRRSILSGWMEQKDGDGRLRGDVMDAGTATFRHSHRVIANIPSGKAVYGKEIRELFSCPDDKVLISGDGASYQIRLLAHYLKSEDYTDTVLNGDSHQRHADIMGVSRDLAKPIFFATIFGAGGNKIGAYLGGDNKRGKEVRQKLIDGIPNFGNLIQKAQTAAKNNKYIPGIDGRRVWVQQGDEYKAINYLIQSCEAILMKQTVVDINKMLEAEGIEYKQLLFYHDELNLEINPKDVERVKEIMEHCFRESPKKFGVQIMEVGDILTGKDYYEIH